MNKTIMGIAIIIVALFMHFGFDLRSQLKDALGQMKDIIVQNASLSRELSVKQGFKRHSPDTIPSAFTSLVNEIKMFETYSGTRMDIMFSTSKEAENIEDYCMDTEFRKVKGLSLTINIEKFSDVTDMVEVLNDVYLLETRTDFKVSEIIMGNGGLIVKGELYGI